MRKTTILILSIVCLSFVQQLLAEGWSYDFENFATATAGDGPKKAIDAELRGLTWHMYGVRSNYDDTDYADGACSMRIYGEVSKAKEMTNFTLMTPREIGTFSFTLRANETWGDYQKSWIVQWSLDGEQWTTIGDAFTATMEPTEIRREINQRNARVRIVRSDYATYDYTTGSNYNYIANIDNMSITDMSGGATIVFSASETALDFGEIKLGESSQKSLELRYEGLDTAPTMEITEADASMYTYSAEGGDGLQTVTVTCRAIRRGATKAVLHIVYGEQSIDVTLTAVGVKANEDQLFSGGDGSEKNPYLISSDLDLVELSDLVEKSRNTFSGKFFRMTNDISLINIKNYRPIGNNFDRTPESEGYLRPFSGTFDGGNHTVSDLNMSRSFNSFCGLFGIVNGATIKNITVSKSKIYAQYGVAAVVGVALGSTVIDNCHTTASVEISNERFYAAGICGGFLQDGEGLITDCTNLATVRGKWGMSAGILASNDQPGLRIQRCGNQGAITDENSYVGGIVASTSKAISITDCYNTGEIYMLNGQGASNTRGAGILGSVQNFQDGLIQISNCYNAGVFNLTAQHMHPIFDAEVFFDEEFIQLHNNYYSQEINSFPFDQSVSVENSIINVPVATMKSTDFLQMLNTSTPPVWAFVEGQNKGFPLPIGKNDTGIQMPDNSLSPAIMVINGQLVICDPNAQVEVYDIEGRNVYADQGRLPQGIYIVKVVTDGDVHIQKIIL